MAFKDLTAELQELITSTTLFFFFLLSRYKSAAQLSSHLSLLDLKKKIKDEKQKSLPKTRLQICFGAISALHNRCVTLCFLAITVHNENEQ